MQVHIEICQFDKIPLRTLMKIELWHFITGLRYIHECLVKLVKTCSKSIMGTIMPKNGTSM